MTSAASLDIVRNVLSIWRTLVLYTDDTFLRDCSVTNTSAQMEMAYVEIEVMTDVRSVLLFCFGLPMFGISGDRTALTAAADYYTQVPNKRVELSCSPVRSVIGFSFFLLEISIHSIL